MNTLFLANLMGPQGLLILFVLLLLFGAKKLPELARGQGVTLQRYRDGGLSDAVAFRLSDGLSWALGGESGRVRTESDLSAWRAARGAAGRMPPIGFPRSNRFD